MTSHRRAKPIHLGLSNMTYREQDINPELACKLPVYRYTLPKVDDKDERYKRYARITVEYFGLTGNAFLLYQSHRCFYTISDREPPPITQPTDHPLYPERVNFTPGFFNPVWIRLLFRSAWTAYHGNQDNITQSGNPLHLVAIPPSDTPDRRFLTGLNLDCFTQQMRCKTQSTVFIRHTPLYFATALPEQIASNNRHLWELDETERIHLVTQRDTIRGMPFVNIRKPKKYRYSLPYLDMNDLNSYNTSRAAIYVDTQQHFIEISNQFGFPLTPVSGTFEKIHHKSRTANFKPDQRQISTDPASTTQQPSTSSSASPPSQSSSPENIPYPSLKLSENASILHILDGRYSKTDFVSKEELIALLRSILDDFGLINITLNTISLSRLNKFDYLEKTLVLLDQEKGVVDDLYVTTNPFKHKTTIQHLCVNPRNLEKHCPKPETHRAEQEEASGAIQPFASYYEYSLDEIKRDKHLKNLHAHLIVCLKELYHKQKLLSPTTFSNELFPGRTDVLEGCTVFKKDTLCGFLDQQIVITTLTNDNSKAGLLSQKLLSKHGFSVDEFYSELIKQWPYNLERHNIDDQAKFLKRATVIFMDDTHIFITDHYECRPTLLPQSLSQVRDHLEKEQESIPVAALYLHDYATLLNCLKTSPLDKSDFNALTTNLPFFYQQWNQAISDLEEGLYSEEGSKLRGIEKNRRPSAQNIRDSFNNRIMENIPNNPLFNRPDGKKQKKFPPQILKSWWTLLSGLLNIELRDPRSNLAEKGLFNGLWYSPDLNTLIVSPLTCAQKKQTRQPGVVSLHSAKGNLDMDSAKRLAGLFDTEFVRCNQLSSAPVHSYFIKLWKDLHDGAEFQNALPVKYYTAAAKAEKTNQQDLFC